MIKVSVIIPIYKVANFIDRCASSLLEQTLDEVEYIFVDDCTPDNSMIILDDVISRYPNRKNNIKILHHDVNKGLPAARNTGLSVASGEYIFHCDSDDFVEPDMLELMYDAAQINNADFVWSDWFLSYEKAERYMKQPNFTTSEEVLKGMLSDAMKYNVWNKLVKHDLYTINKIHFPSGHSMGEDMTMICLAVCAKKVVYVNKAFYHYVKTNSEAMTQSYKENHLRDIRYNVERTVSFIKEKSTINLEKYISFFKLNVKLPFLITSEWSSYRRWSVWYPEANKYIMHNERLSIRTRLLQFMAYKKMYFIVWIYNVLVYRVIYKILYQS